MVEEITWGDEEDFGKKEGISFGEILLRQIARITQLQSQEFRGGYEEEVVKMVNGQQVVEKRYIEDTREAYVNAVNCLYDMMYSKFDDDSNNSSKGMKEFDKYFKDSKKELANKLNQEVSENKISKDKAMDKMANKHREMFRRLMPIAIEETKERKV